MALSVRERETDRQKDRQKHKHRLIHSFIHSGYFYSASSSPLLLKRSRHSRDTVLEFHAESPQLGQVLHSQAIASGELAQGPYVAAKAGFEPATLWTKGVDATMRHHAQQTQTRTTDTHIAR